MRRRKLALVAVILISGFERAAADVTTATVTGGRVRGVRIDGVTSFKGIPFAAPPVGKLRWRAPQPVEPWEDVKNADAFAPAPIQHSGLAAAMGISGEFSEDCLYLNVWTPATSAFQRLPVMVWIYGGAFAGGATSSPVYDGTNLAKKGVLVVSVAYRVGPVGFLAHPELSREGGGVSGNYGLRDQIAGLEWVKQNISAFGGDPSRVTIFGESAGGISVSMLAASPGAKGLFQRAISQSGGSFAPPKFADEGGQKVPPLKVAEVEGERFLSGLGAQDIRAARELPVAALVTSGFGFWPTFDGDVLPGDQYELYQAGRFNDTPILVGTNSDEGAMFVRPGVTSASLASEIRRGFGEHADRILAVYPHSTPAEALTASKNIVRDSAFAWHTWSWAKLQSEKGKGRAYVYYFDCRGPQSPAGASHAAELGHVFRNLGRPGTTPRADDVTLSELMSSYWVNFATSGDPNDKDLPVWPAFSAANEQVMRLGTTPGAQPTPNLEQLKALDAYYAWRREQARKRDG